MLTVGSLFAGIGGFDLGFERAGLRTLWQVEIDSYCRGILARHFPDAERFDDVRNVGSHNLAPVDLVCGGFPCQPVSVGGQRLTEEDTRWLWPEYARVVGELRPRYVVVENVPGLLERGLGAVLGSLAELGYDAEWDVLPASAFGAPHARERVWLVAYASADRRFAACSREDGHEGEARSPTQPPGELGSVAPVDTTRRHQKTRRDPRGPVVFGRGIGECPRRDAEPRVDRVVTRLPERVDRVNALGNSLVPQIAEYLGQRLLAAEGGVK